MEKLGARRLRRFSVARESGMGYFSRCLTSHVEAGSSPRAVTALREPQLLVTTSAGAVDLDQSGAVRMW